ncbi:MAG: hypothetical protein ABJ239_07380 [Erythrobacter sp.]
MHKEGDEIHIEDTDAMGAAGTGRVRWILIIGLFLAVGLLTLIWVSGALSYEETPQAAKVSANAPAEAMAEELDTAEVVDEAAIEAADALEAEAATEPTS